jgi:hypothetical protein
VEKNDSYPVGSHSHPAKPGKQPEANIASSFSNGGTKRMERKQKPRDRVPKRSSLWRPSYSKHGGQHRTRRSKSPVTGTQAMVGKARPGSESVADACVDNLGTREIPVISAERPHWGAAVDQASRHGSGIGLACDENRYNSRSAERAKSEAGAMETGKS